MAKTRQIVYLQNQKILKYKVNTYLNLKRICSWLLKMASSQSKFPKNVWIHCFSTSQIKVKHHFFMDSIKLKIPSKIKPHLIIMKIDIKFLSHKRLWVPLFLKFFFHCPYIFRRPFWCLMWNKQWSFLFFLAGRPPTLPSIMADLICDEVLTVEQETSEHLQNEMSNMGKVIKVHLFREGSKFYLLNPSSMFKNQILINLKTFE